MMPTIYFDTSCLGRPFDDQSQDRIRLEAEAVVLIFAHIQDGDWQWTSSEVVDYEIQQTPDPVKRARISRLAAMAQHSVLVEDKMVERAVELQALGFKAFDALHLACAESGGADVFLATDDRLLRQASRIADRLLIRVENPLIWLREEIGK
jgi:predicted nucleic acid-binding protein